MQLLLLSVIGEAEPTEAISVITSVKSTNILASESNLHYSDKKSGPLTPPRGRDEKLETKVLNLGTVS